MYICYMFIYTRIYIDIYNIYIIYWYSDIVINLYIDILRYWYMYIWIYWHHKKKPTVGEPASHQSIIDLVDPPQYGQRSRHLLEKARLVKRTGQLESAQIVSDHVVQQVDEHNAHIVIGKPKPSFLKWEPKPKILSKTLSCRSGAKDPKLNILS